MTPVIYHNPRCSKSRAAKAILEENVGDIEVIEYLKTPLNYAQLQNLIEALGCGVRGLMRTGEAVYQEKNLSDKMFSDQQLIQAMADYPILIERPIVKTDNGICIARPPERVYTLL